MSHVTRLTVLLSALAVALLLLGAPAVATESGGGGETGGETTQTEGGGGEGEREKIEIPEDPHDRVGLVLVALIGIAALLALDNARRQLKGERRQATGEWRWR